MKFDVDTTSPRFYDVLDFTDVSVDLSDSIVLTVTDSREKKHTISLLPTMRNMHYLNYVYYDLNGLNFYYHEFEKYYMDIDDSGDSALNCSYVNFIVTEDNIILQCENSHINYELTWKAILPETKKNIDLIGSMRSFLHARIKYGNIQKRTPIQNRSPLDEIQHENIHIL